MGTKEQRNPDNVNSVVFTGLQDKIINYTDYFNFDYNCRLSPSKVGINIRTTIFPPDNEAFVQFKGEEEEDSDLEDNSDADADTDIDSGADTEDTKISGKDSSSNGRKSTKSN